ncbi:hypothetical protein ACTFIW_003895 [Dictyostelium discoideum]
MSSNRREMLTLLMVYQALYTGPISSVRTTLETMPQEESQLDWRLYSRILQYGSVRISPKPSNNQLLNNQNECTPLRLESMQAMSRLPITHSFSFYPGEDQLIQFEEGFYNTGLNRLNSVADVTSASDDAIAIQAKPKKTNSQRSQTSTIFKLKPLML